MPVLIDTNVLVYVFDHGDPARQDQAIRVLQHLQLNGSGRLSAQSLAEFCAVTTRGLQPLLTRAEAAVQVERFARAFRVLDVTPMIVLEAARGARDHGLAYYDAQIWAAARLNQVAVVFSEDFNTGATLEGVRFVNPFAANFALEVWA
ncbi:MAG TPA: PIN domain-containing protein [Anaerolineae bacterium]|nr:PIN domain-containing protein [Anaerolineae bacterium]